MHRKLLPVLIFLFACLASPAIVAETLELAPAKDNTLYEDVEGRFTNGTGKRLFIGRVGPDGDELKRRAVLAFDVSGIPPNAVIDSVRFEIQIEQVPPGAPDDNEASLHLLTKSWGEGFANAPGSEGQGTSADTGSVTWIHTMFDADPMAATFWDSPGGDYEAIASATAPFGAGSPEPMVFLSTPQLVADVQTWLNQPEANHGWMLRGDEVTSKNARGLASREHPTIPAPKLIIDYSIPSAADNLSLLSPWCRVFEPQRRFR